MLILNATGPGYRVGVREGVAAAGAQRRDLGNRKLKPEAGKTARRLNRHPGSNPEASGS